MSSKELLLETLGVYDLHAYEEGKRFYMKLGRALPKALLERVGGREALHGERCDGVTALGRWEFCTQGNTKNDAGNRSDLLRCPGHCVQILGHPNPGWISGAEFLARHGVEPTELEAIVRRVATECAKDARQTRLPL